MGETPHKALPLAGQSDIDVICDEFEAAVGTGKPADIADYLHRARPSDRPALRRALKSIQALHERTGPRNGVSPPARDPKLLRFVRTLVASHLMPRAEVDAFLACLPPEEQPQTGEDLAKALYRHHRLTRFQTQAVFQGKTKGLVLGNYVILDKIGQGGMGYVYKAQHKRMERTVAVKILPAHVSRQKDALERFHREVVAAARLSHPNIVTAHDADEAEGVHFLVMEYVEGTDLAQLVRSKGTLSVDKALDYVLQVANGLKYAHEEGVVHRDIKPSNLLLDQHGTIKILDMGLARFERELQESIGDQSLTQDGQLMGTIDYMAPEQALDTHHADAQADIYSLGCTLHYLLTGQPAFQGQTMATKILAHRDHPIPSLRDRRSDVPEALDRIFQQMLAKHPENRQRSMAQVISEMENGCDLGQELRDTTAMSSGSMGGTSTLPCSSNGSDVPVTPPPDDATSDSSKSTPSDWLRQKLPELPTMLRANGKRSKRRDVLLTLGIATTTLLVALLLAYLMSPPSSATLLIHVNESEATVRILDADDREEVSRQSGAEPISIRLPPGIHQIRIEKPGFEILSKRFELETGSKQSVRAHLTPISPLSPSESQQSAQARGPVDRRPSAESAERVVSPPGPQE